jgi:hypothetical protein
VRISLPRELSAPTLNPTLSGYFFIFKIKRREYAEKVLADYPSGTGGTMPDKKPTLPELRPKHMIPFGDEESQRAARAIDGRADDDPNLRRPYALTMEEEADLLARDAVKADCEE